MRIEPVVRKISPEEDDAKNDLEYWLSRSPRERIEAMTLLREQYFILLGYQEPPRIENTVTRRK